MARIKLGWWRVRLWRRAALSALRALGKWRPRIPWRWALGGLAVAALVGLALFAVIWLPELQVPTGPLSEAQEKRLTLVNEFRRTWAGVAGAVVVFAGLYLGWRRVRALEGGQITERFTRAIDQLGTTHGTGREPKIEVRLGGIFALEQIAKDDPAKYHWQVMEVLTAYVRENTPTDGEPREKPREDVQTALTVVGRRKIEHDAPAVGPGEGTTKFGSTFSGRDLRAWT